MFTTTNQLQGVRFTLTDKATPVKAAHDLNYQLEDFRTDHEGTEWFTVLFFDREGMHRVPYKADQVLHYFETGLWSVK